MGDTDKQFTARLIEDYYCYLDLRKSAQDEGAAETVKKIDKKLKIIKLQLQPLELPED
ncbi:MAG: hypothetical protein NC253_05140 [Ruminococcus sp.]|nr:hypothetical protein [Ruminococcus sp.]MCM1382000.1 hypothetical protein [Muribaculaceae bacterium]MCM1478354.1 hypothetical protein [Muribaculaceae bacterium]